MTSEKQAKYPHRTPHEASHQPWEYSPGAVIWVGDTPAFPNIEPAAARLRAWLTRKSSTMWEPGKYVDPELENQRNPYTASLVTLAGSIGLIINDASSLAELDTELEPVEFDLRRIRLETELILHAARFCEASIKQMLHCTDLSRQHYRDAALGQLLSMDCRSCRKAGLPTHDFSLLGSIAHQYFLCHEFDGCAIDHLILVNKKRKLEAAHSSAQGISWGTVEESRSRLKTTLEEVGGAFVHLLEHVATAEAAMIKEINIRIAHYPNMPPREAYDFFLTRTVTNYDDNGVYQGPGYRDRLMRSRRSQVAATDTPP